MKTVLKILCMLALSSQAVWSHQTMPIELSTHASRMQLSSDPYVLVKFPLDDETAEEGMDFIVQARGLNINRSKSRWHLVDYVYDKYKYSTPILTQWLIYRFLGGVSHGDVIGMAAVELNKTSLRIGYHFLVKNLEVRNETHDLLKSYYCAMMGEKIFSIDQLQAHRPINNFPLGELKASQEGCSQLEAIKTDFYNTATPEAMYNEIQGYNDVGDRFDLFDVTRKANCPAVPDNATFYLQVAGGIAVLALTYYLFRNLLVQPVGLQPYNPLLNLFTFVTLNMRYIFQVGYRNGAFFVRQLRVYMNDIFKAGMAGDVYDATAVESQNTDSAMHMPPEDQALH